MSFPPATQFIRSHVCLKLPAPSTSFSGQTVIVTGSNTGLGLEAARHIVRLGAEKVVLAVRSLSRGRAAAESIAKHMEGSKTMIEVWELDLASYASIQKFATKADALLPRLDVVVENAGILTESYEVAEDDERTIKVNVLGTMLLAILLLPKLRETAETFHKNVVLTFTGSWMHWATNFPEQDAENIFEELAIKSKARMANNERYSTSKLIELLAFRELAANLTQPKNGHIITSIVNPGAVSTDIVRDEKGLAFKAWVVFCKAVLMRSPEEGSRTLVHAAEGHRETDGQYLSECEIASPNLLSPFVKSDKGARVQKKVWQQMLHRLESVQPGLTHNV